MFIINGSIIIDMYMDMSGFIVNCGMGQNNYPGVNIFNYIPVELRNGTML